MLVLNIEVKDIDVPSLGKNGYYHNPYKTPNEKHPKDDGIDMWFYDWTLNDVISYIEEQLSGGITTVPGKPPRPEPTGISNPIQYNNEKQLLINSIKRKLKNG